MQKAQFSKFFGFLAGVICAVIPIGNPTRNRVASIVLSVRRPLEVPGL